MNPDDLARYRDEDGNKWVLVHSHGGAPQLFQINADGSRQGPHEWDDVAGRHQLSRLYPPPGDLT